MNKKKRRPIIAVLNDWGTVQDIFDNLGAYTLDIDGLSEVGPAMKAADAVVFTGGGDINPERYGWGTRHARVYGVSDHRDEVEFAAFALARKRRIPVLGICRGAQLINVGHGGTLHQDIFDGAPPSLLPHSGTDHAVKVRRSSRIGQVLGSGILKDVTSLHHQAVDRLGDGLVPVGWAPDGTVEMIETAPGVRPYMLGTQFHPEMDITSSTAEYDVWSIFEHIFKLAKQHSVSRGGDYDARYASVDYLTGHSKFFSNPAPSKTVVSTPSGESVARYLDRVPGLGSDYDTVYEPEDEEDSYDAWLARNTMHRRAVSDIDRADSMCVLSTGCQCPLDCLTYGDCAADGVSRQTVKDIVDEMTRQGKRGSKR